MTLSSSTLADALESLTPTALESQVITRLVAAFSDYFGEATVSGAPVTGSLSGPEFAMATALIGVTAFNQGATKLAAGVTAYWGAVVPASTWVVPGSVLGALTPPPGLPGLAATLAATFASNTSTGVTLEQAAANVAANIHTASTGAIVAATTGRFPTPFPVL